MTSILDPLEENQSLLLKMPNSNYTQMNTGNVADIGLHRYGKESKPNSFGNEDFSPMISSEIESNFDSKPSSDNHSSQTQEKSSNMSSSTNCHCFRKLKKCILDCLKPCQRKHYIAPDNTCRSRVIDAILCPPTGICASGLVFILSAIILWSVIWSLTGNLALPGGSLFALIILGIGCAVGGKIASLLRLPPLIGMLIVGFMLRNVPMIDCAKDLDPEWSSAFRTIALAVILTRAGLGLDPAALRRLSFVCFRLAFLPCLAECVTVAIAIHFLLNFPWLWGFMLGFVLAAVSPAVIVPSMLHLQERNLGVKKGIPTLVIAAASIDDVLAIGGFGVTLGLTFSTGNLIMTIMHGPIEVLMGISYGGIVGIILWFLPASQMENMNFFRFLLLFGSGLFALFGSRVSGFAGSGALACLILSFVAALGWRKDSQESLTKMSEYFSYLWIFFQPFLFGLIGAELDVNNLKSDVIGLGLATLGIGLVIRIIVSSLAVMGANLSLKERFFISLAWLPKATVQAAIGPVALDYVRENHLNELEYLGIQVLTMAVLSILITAPIGAACIAISAPKLLSLDNDTKVVAISDSKTTLEVKIGDLDRQNFDVENQDRDKEQKKVNDQMNGDETKL